MKLDEAVQRLEALGNPTRLRICRILVAAGVRGMAVGRLQSRLRIAASTLSHHLKTMIGAGLVSQTRDGTSLICHANPDAMRGLVAYLREECGGEGEGGRR
jgi:DNA-binding transcriptional ArsR family regulator